MFMTGKNDHTWCRRLETIDPRLETIKLAVPGYGVDHAYLSYRRDVSQALFHVRPRRRHEDRRARNPVAVE